MSKITQEIVNEKDIKKLPINHHKVTIIKKNISNTSNPRNKTSFPSNRRNRIQINTKEDLYLQRKSFNNEFNYNNSQNEDKIENNENNNLNNNNNLDTNFSDNENYLIEDNQTNEKPPNAIEISDLIGEKCPIDIDILSINFNSYESSKTSSKPMGLIRAYGANTYQGLVRNYNEDRVSIIINMARPKNYTKNYWPKTSFFGIYDGHGGNQCAEFLRDCLHKLILNDQNYPENVELAIKNGFQNAEKTFLNNYAVSPTDSSNVIDRSGSCAVVILFVDYKIYVANVGDSRALFSENNGKNFVAITEDHKPNNPKEKNRIIKSGGQVYQSQTVISGTDKENLNGQILFGPYRVLPGRLSVSRTIGDIEAKSENFGGNPNVIIPIPDIFIYDLNKNKIDFFIMGCDGIFDQMSNEEIINCAWMILNNNKNKKEDKNIDEENLDNDNIEYNFENYNIHEKCGLIVDFIIKASMVRKSFDNVTCLMIALKDFINIEENNNLENNENHIYLNNNTSDLNSHINTRPKKSSQIIARRRNEIIKPEKPKVSDNQLLSSNNAIFNDIKKDIPRNIVKENLKLTNFINSKNNKLNNEENPRTFRNNRTDNKDKNNFSTNNNIISNNKIYIRKRKEKNLQKKKTNKTEVNINNNDNNNLIIKKMLNKSEVQDIKKNELSNNFSNNNRNSIEKTKNIINKDKLNPSQSQNDIENNYCSPLISKNNNNRININSNNIIHKIKHNKISRVPFELNNPIISKINNNTEKNNLNVNFNYSNNYPTNYRKISNINTSSVGNNSNINSSNTHTSSGISSNNYLNFHIKPKKIKNYTKPKTFRYSNNLSQYRRTFNKTNLYSTNTHNISDNNSNHNLYSHKYSNNLGIRPSKNRGSMSSRKKKFSYQHIIKTLSMNDNNNNINNNMKTKISRFSNRRLAYSKEKDIHNFLYKNKTNISRNQNESNEASRKGIKFTKITLRSDNKRIKKIS